MPPEQRTTTFIADDLATKTAKRHKNNHGALGSIRARRPPLFTLCDTSALAKHAAIRLFLNPVERSAPLVIAHRGASAHHPENTLTAFHAALDLNVDGIELDVQTTADDMPVVFHDFTLSRLTGQRGRLAQRSWRELTSLRVADTEKIPRLSHVLRVIGHRAVVQIELKRGVHVAPLIAAIRRVRAARRVILASFDLTILAETTALAPKIPRMLITEGKGGPAKLLRHMQSVGAVGVSVNHEAILDAAFVAELHAAGATVWTWTVNDPRRMRTLARFGVDAILTDDPALLKKALG
jgi:glycerophosphoryl diester phosphodiesterase